MTRDEFRFQPGWATPVVVDYRKPGVIDWLLRRLSEPACRAEQQGRCPGKNLCHDCAWSPSQAG